MGGPANLQQALAGYGQRMIDPNTQLNFEQRILRPTQYPQMNLPDGRIATHKMMWNEMGGQAIAFPSIIQDKEGNLRELAPRQAMEHAIQSGEYRKFPTAKEAEGYANGGYKQHWGEAESRESLADALRKLGQ